MRPTLYEAVGGAPALLRLAHAHNARCLADPVLQHPFSHGGHPQHVERLAAYWVEALGGPAEYTERCGGESAALGLHAGQGAEDDLGVRFEACFALALDDAGLPADPELHAALRAYMAWAVAQFLAVAPEGSAVPAGLAVPRWSWSGLVGRCRARSPYSLRVADVSVRPARPHDAERVARVQLSTWRTAYADLLPADALDLPEEQVAALWLHAVEAPASPRHRLLVALERDELVGFLATSPAEDDDLDAPTTAEVAALLVEPRWGRRGHGSRLLSAAVDGWRSDGPLTAAGWEPDGRSRGLDTGARVQPQRRFHVDVTP